MDVQQFFKSFNFCLKVLESTGLITKNKYFRILWILMHFFCFNGFLPGTIINLNLKNEELWKSAEKIHLILGLIGMNIKIFKILSKIDEIRKMKEKTEKIIQKLDIEKFGEEDYEPIKNEKRFLKRIFIFYYVSTLFPLFTATVLIPFFRKLPYKIVYPFNLKNFEWLQVAIFHQVYCHIFGSTLLMSISFLSVIFISYSIGFLGSIHRQLYFKVGQGREQVLMDCMESYKMIKELMNDVRKHFEFVFLFQAIMSVVRLGILFFIIYETSEMASRLIAISLCAPFALEILIPCHFGQDLKISSKNAIKGFSYPKWEDLNEQTENERNKFLNSMSQKFIEIRLKTFMNLNLKTFTGLIVFIIVMMCIYIVAKTRLF